MKRMELKIDKKKLENRLTLEIIEIFISALMIALMINILGIVHLNIVHLIPAIGALFAVYFFVSCFFVNRFVDTLRYEIESDRVSISYEVITKSLKTARLQIVNEVSAVQGMLDKMFDMYTLTIGYGVEDKYCILRFLSEKEARKAMKMIMPTGKFINVNIK